MDMNLVILVIAVGALLISFYCIYSVNEMQKKAKAAGPDGYTTKPLQLQAYERLVMLTERISLSGLVSRANQAGMSARDMQILLLESIKQEYEYNSSQQIYVSPV